MTRDQFVSLFFIALLIFVVYQIFRIFAPFFHAIFWGAILAFGFYPLYESLKKKLKQREGLAAFLMTVVVFLIVIPPVLILLANVAEQAIELYFSVSSFVQRGGPEELIEYLRTVSWIQAFEDQYLQWEPIKRGITDWVLSAAHTIGNFGAGQAGIITKNILFVTLNILLVFVLVFVFFKDGNKIYKFIYNVAPLEEKNKKYIFRQINETFAAVIRGQLLTSLSQAVVAGVVFWSLGQHRQDE